jgi:hypothetical protein
MLLQFRERETNDIVLQNIARMLKLYFVLIYVNSAVDTADVVTDRDFDLCVCIAAIFGRVINNINFGNRQACGPAETVTSDMKKGESPPARVLIEIAEPIAVT